jgi:hypothetical protein
MKYFDGGRDFSLIDLEMMIRDLNESVQSASDGFEHESIGKTINDGENSFIHLQK